MLMITPAIHIADKIFELDMPVEEMLPRQQMLLKKQVLDILREWQSEFCVEIQKRSRI